MTTLHYIPFTRTHDLRNRPPSKTRYGRLLYRIVLCLHPGVYDVSPPTGLFPFPIPPLSVGGGWFPLRQSSSVYPRVRDFSLLTEPESERAIAKGKNVRRIYNDRRTDFLSSLLGNTLLGKAVEGEFRAKTFQI